MSPVGLARTGVPLLTHGPSSCIYPSVLDKNKADWEVAAARRPRPESEEKAWQSPGCIAASTAPAERVSGDEHDLRDRRAVRRHHGPRMRGRMSGRLHLRGRPLAL